MAINKTQLSLLMLDEIQADAAKRTAVLPEIEDGT